MESARKPLNLLQRSQNRPVVVRLKSDLEYRGKMVHCDMYMNLILDSATEYYEQKPVATYGNVFIRGNNILFISLEPSEK